MYTVTFTGFKTALQAQAFADWYEGQGEQDVATWMEEHTGVSSCNTEKVLSVSQGYIVMLNVKEAK